ncbi:MAG: hypothetical protein IIY29_04035, partial [Firmicutes bacterium]|nr:hypothetical protein [Bacillota bacterium]
MYRNNCSDAPGGAREAINFAGVRRIIARNQGTGLEKQLSEARREKIAWGLNESRKRVATGN